MNSKTKKVISNVVLVISAVIIAGGGVVKIAGLADARLTMVGVGPYIKLFGIMDVLFAALFVYHKTFKLGFILICCYFGGAMATELSHGKSIMGVIVPLTIVWLAAFLRDRSVFFENSVEGVSNTKILTGI